MLTDTTAGIGSTFEKQNLLSVQAQVRVELASSIYSNGTIPLLLAAKIAWNGQFPSEKFPMIPPLPQSGSVTVYLRDGETLALRGFQKQDMPLPSIKHELVIFLTPHIIK